MKKQNNNKKSFKAIYILAVIMTLIGVILAGSLGLKKQFALPGELLGYTLSPVLIGVLVVGILQVFAKYRNKYSRIKVYVITLACLCLVFVVKVLQALT